MSYFDKNFVVDMAGPVCESKQKCEASHRANMSKLAHEIGLGGLHRQM